MNGNDSLVVCQPSWLNSNTGLTVVVGLHVEADVGADPLGRTGDAMPPNSGLGRLVGHLEVERHGRIGQADLHRRADTRGTLRVVAPPSVDALRRGHGFIGGLRLGLDRHAQQDRCHLRLLHLSCD